MKVSNVQKKIYVLVPYRSIGVHLGNIIKVALGRF